ncbi:MAG: SufD family Fe-S cluster assembly protein [Spirochaetales bacterium]|nr:SufD family Fe-S cluster assembly protein [Spirochaetales bacterium]
MNGSLLLENKSDLIKELLEASGIHSGMHKDPETAYLVVHHDKVVGLQGLPGLEVEPQEKSDGIHIRFLVKAGTHIKKPVYLCFGMMQREGVQKILMDVTIEKRAKVNIFAHCTFPNSMNIVHRMNAEIHVENDAHYSYFERHIHGDEGGISVYPKAKVVLEEGAHFKTEFELLKGRVGLIDIDYECTCRALSVLEMMARISGRGDDVIKINETGHLLGKSARGVLTTKIAVRDKAKAEVYNTLTAGAPYARGHVDCKEIVQDQAQAKAVPVIEVNDPKAHITHEAALGSVDSKQLQTLMSRGLTEDEGVELIIKGLLR